MRKPLTFKGFRFGVTKFEKDNTGELEIRPMRASDIKAVAEIEALSFTPPLAERHFSEQLRVGQRYYIVARLDGKVVGFAGMALEGDKCHITRLAVHPQLRGQGVGTALLLALLRGAKRRRAIVARLEVRKSNKIAQKLYEKLGFRRVGVTPYYYSDGEDAIAYELWDFGEPASGVSDNGHRDTQ
jgi:ribosomal-protein-alanine N-acetyltransferase